jgi:hypothetical protein
MDLDNVFTAGTKGIPVPHDTNKSQCLVPSNEDWTMVCEVLSVSEGVIEVKKIWDKTGKVYKANLKYLGFMDTPPDTSVLVGSYVVLHRTGDYDSCGSEGLELHSKDLTKTSWICFVTSDPWIWVYDVGEGLGREAKKNANHTFSANLDTPLYDLQSIDHYYHNDNPPWKEGRVYRGRRYDPTTQHEGFYLVNNPGYGSLAKSFMAATSTANIKIDVDGSGNILEVTGA